MHRTQILHLVIWVFFLPNFSQATVFTTDEIQRIQNDAQAKKLAKSGGETILCLRDLLNHDLSVSNLKFALATADNIRRIPDKVDYFDHLTQACQSRLSKSQKSGEQELDSVLSKINQIHYSQHALALIQTLVNPKMIACKVNNSVEFFEDLQPWHWGQWKCIREDGKRWREWTVGTVESSFETNDIFGDIIKKIQNNQLSEEEMIKALSENLEKLENQENVPEQSETPKRSLLSKILFGPTPPDSGSFFTFGGVAYRWQNLQADRSDLSYINYSAVGSIRTAGVYSCLLDQRFQGQFSKNPAHDTYYGSDFGSFSPPTGQLPENVKGYIFKNRHKKFMNLKDNGKVLFNRLIHRHFKFYPFGQGPDEENLFINDPSNFGCSLAE